MSDARVRTTVEVQLALGQSALDRGDGRAALEWFRAAARGGDARAFNMIGRCYERGWGVKPDPAMAADWFRRAAAMGDAWAMFNLADLYCRGHGVPADPEAAFGLYARSARRGNAKALNMLGLFREEGRFGPPDLKAAAELFHAAAKGGDCWGAFNLGRLLAQAGETALARGWFEKALAAGFPDFWRAMAAALEESGMAELAPLARQARQRVAEAERRAGPHHRTPGTAGAPAVGPREPGGG
ncbi:tetratricopeptide repeat protein [Camelimonas abortus]|uniref:Tetratricopeptide repeat protein n=1 Tax=Camelimonas abortus TaxID=1017184 RepID=A0ABV7LAS1_9HYPH